MADLTTIPGVGTWRRIPAEPMDWFDPEEVQKVKDYERPLRRTKWAENLISYPIAIWLIGSGQVSEWGRSLADGWFLQLIAMFAIVILVDELISLPRSIWATFVHEEKYGFNTNTPGRFAVDLVKNLVIATILTGAVIGGVFWVIRRYDTWWVYGWIAYVLLALVLGLVMTRIVPRFFNKFSPMEEGDLKEKLRALARKAKLNVAEFKVVDASKRTTRDNAYVTGLGPTREVVVYDNMLERSDEFVEAVIAHELGHWRLKHISKSLLVMLPLTLLMFAVMPFILRWRPALDFFHAGTERDPEAALLFAVGFSVLFSVVGMVQSLVSRAFERQADLQSLALTEAPEAYRSMTRDLHVDNMADLAPSKWKYLKRSHPPPAERLELSKLWEQAHAESGAV